MLAELRVSFLANVPFVRLIVTRSAMPGELSCTSIRHASLLPFICDYDYDQHTPLHFPYQRESARSYDSLTVQPPSRLRSLRHIPSSALHGGIPTVGEFRGSDCE
jgi:hypothetical protein